MKQIKKFAWLIYIIIPALAVHLSLVFETAQGEDVEEILSGIMIGLAVDLILFALYKLIKRIKGRVND